MHTVALDTKQQHPDEFPHKLNESGPARLVLKSMLVPGERLLQIGKVSSGIYWKSVAVLFLSVLFMLVLVRFNVPWQLMLLAGGFLTLKVLTMFIVAYLRRHYLLLVATDQRVIVRYGIINLEVMQMRYSQIESSEVFSTLPGRFLGYAAVIISGNGGHSMAVPFISNALDFRKAISEILINREDVPRDSDLGRYQNAKKA